MPKEYHRHSTTVWLVTIYHERENYTQEIFATKPNAPTIKAKFNVYLSDVQLKLIDKVCGYIENNRNEYYATNYPSGQEIVEMKEMAVHRRVKTHCINGHKFTKDNTYMIRNVKGCVACRKMKRHQSDLRKLNESSNR